MEKKPKTIEELFEMHDEIISLEEQGKELNVSVDKMILRQKVLQDLVKRPDPSDPKDEIKKHSLIGDIDKDIERYGYWKINWKNLVEKRIDYFRQLDVNKIMKFRNHPSQLDPIQPKDIFAIQFIFKLLIENHSHALRAIREKLKEGEEIMDKIEEYLIECFKKKGIWPEMLKAVEEEALRATNVEDTQQVTHSAGDLKSPAE